MNPIVILFISHLAFNIQVDACIGGDWAITAARLKNNADEDLNKFTAYIDRLKTNYIQELIDLKVAATFNDIDSIAQYFDGPAQSETSSSVEKTICIDNEIFGIIVMMANISQGYKKCVTDQFDKLSAIEDALEDSIDEWSSCPLDLNPPLAFICRRRPRSATKVCIEVNKHVNRGTHTPSACGEAQRNARNNRLRVVAEDLASRGISNATKCISYFQQEFNTTFLTFIDIIENCQDNLE